jgi:UDPglucose 6-dehydrogenase
VTITRSVFEASKGADAVVIATDWVEFKKADWASIYGHMNKPAFVFDGRVLLNAAELRKVGFRVSC